MGPPIRESPVSSLVDLYYTQSTNGGASFHSPIRVSNVTTNWCDTMTNRSQFGDYNTAVSAGNRLFTTWLMEERFSDVSSPRSAQLVNLKGNDVKEGKKGP